MSNYVNDLLIIFKSGRAKVISDVSIYGIENGDMFYFIKNKYKSFIPVDGVIYFGRQFDFGDDYEDFGLKKLDLPKIGDAENPWGVFMGNGV